MILHLCWEAQEFIALHGPRGPGLLKPLSMSDFDSSKAVFKSRAQTLAALLATGEERAKLWRPEDLAAMFRHQMSAPVVVDLGGFDASMASRLRTLSEAQGLVLKSFGDLFEHPAPPLELLKLVKNFAKANLDHPESGLPDEIATVLYYLSIASALVRLGRRISKLPNAELQSGLRWTAGQAWVDEKHKTLIAEALRKLSNDQEPQP